MGAGNITSDISEGLQDLQRVIQGNHAFRYYRLQKSRVEVVEVVAFFSWRGGAICACAICNSSFLNCFLLDALSGN